MRKCDLLHERFRDRTVDEWRDALLCAADSPTDEFPGFTHIPILGSADLKSGLVEAFKLYEIARPHLDACVGEGRKYLDFGCGVGRVLRTFMRDFSAENMYGIDPMEKFIDICKGDFSDSFNFSLIETRPPSDLPDNTFDVVTAYSVFSHFSATQATRWLDEFARICRSGATLILTTYGRGHINYLFETPNDKLPAGHQKQRSAIEEAGGRDDLFRMLDLGEMIYRQSGNTFGQYDYGYAYVGRKFVERIWARHFEIIDLVDEYDRLEQMIVVLRKP